MLIHFNDATVALRATGNIRRMFKIRDITSFIVIH